MLSGAPRHFLWRILTHMGTVHISGCTSTHSVAFQNMNTGVESRWLHTVPILSAVRDVIRAHLFVVVPFIQDGSYCHHMRIRRESSMLLKKSSSLEVLLWAGDTHLICIIGVPKKLFPRSDHEHLCLMFLSSLPFRWVSGLFLSRCWEKCWSQHFPRDQSHYHCDPPRRKIELVALSQWTHSWPITKIRWRVNSFSSTFSNSVPKLNAMTLSVDKNILVCNKPFTYVSDSWFCVHLWMEKTTTTIFSPLSPFTPCKLTNDVSPARQRSGASCLPFTPLAPNSSPLLRNCRLLIRVTRGLLRRRR